MTKFMLAAIGGEKQENTVKIIFDKITKNNLKCGRFTLRRSIDQSLLHCREKSPEKITDISTEIYIETDELSFVPLPPGALLVVQLCSSPASSNPSAITSH